MRILSRFSYQKLRQEVIFDQEHDQYERKVQVIRRSSPRKSFFRRLKKRKFRVKVAKLRRLFKIRRIKAAKLFWAKVIKRLKESQSHFGDLFAGNYMFMQVTPASFNNKTCLAQLKHNTHTDNDKLSGFSSRDCNEKQIFRGRNAMQIIS